MEYMTTDTETKNQYLLDEYERELIKKRISKGLLVGNTGDFLYSVEINIGTPVQSLTEKAKKHLFKVISDNLLKQGTEFQTALNKTIRINRGESGLSIEDLKSFNTPIGRNGVSFILLQVEAQVHFFYKKKKSLV